MYARGTVMGSQLGTDGAEYGVGRGPAVGGFAGESSAYVGEDIAEESRGWMPKNAPRGAVMTDAGAGAFRMTTVSPNCQSVATSPRLFRPKRGPWPAVGPGTESRSFARAHTGDGADGVVSGADGGEREEEGGAQLEPARQHGRLAARQPLRAEEGARQDKGLLDGERARVHAAAAAAAVGGGAVEADALGRGEEGGAETRRPRRGGRVGRHHPAGRAARGADARDPRDLPGELCGRGRHVVGAAVQADGQVARGGVLPREAGAGLRVGRGRRADLRRAARPEAEAGRDPDAQPARVHAVRRPHVQGAGAPRQPQRAGGAARVGARAAEALRRHARRRGHLRSLDVRPDGAGDVPIRLSLSLSLSLSLLCPLLSSHRLSRLSSHHLSRLAPSLTVSHRLSPSLPPLLSCRRSTRSRRCRRRAAARSRTRRG